MMRRVVGMVAVVGTLLLVIVIERTAPSSAKYLAPVSIGVGAHDVARTPNFDARLDGAVTTRRITAQDPLADAPTTLTSPVGFLVVTVIAQAAQQPTQIETARVIDTHGRTWNQSRLDPLSSIDLSTVSLAPGLPDRAQLVFEMPASAVRGAKLQLSAEGFQELEGIASLPVPAAGNAATVSLTAPIGLPPGSLTDRR